MLNRILDGKSPLVGPHAMARQCSLLRACKEKRSTEILPSDHLTQAFLSERSRKRNTITTKIESSFWLVAVAMSFTFVPRSRHAGMVDADCAGGPIARHRANSHPHIRTCAHAIPYPSMITQIPSPLAIQSTITRNVVIVARDSSSSQKLLQGRVASCINLHAPTRS